MKNKCWAAKLMGADDCPNAGVEKLSAVIDEAKSVPNFVRLCPMHAKKYRARWAEEEITAAEEAERAEKAKGEGLTRPGGSMARFTLTIRTDNEAFADDPGPELARLLRKTAGQVETGSIKGPLLDINGNRVGEYRLGRK